MGRRVEVRGVRAVRGMRRGAQSQIPLLVAEWVPFPHPPLAPLLSISSDYAGRLPLASPCANVTAALTRSDN